MLRHPALAVLGAFAFSNTLLWGRAGQRTGVGLPAMLSVRFALTGLIMLGVLAALGRPLLPAHGERLIVFVLGVIAYGVESIFFFLALEHGSTAVVVLLFYTHVVVVALGEVLLGALRPTLRIAASVLLAVGGGGIVAFASSGDVHLEGIGFVYIASSLVCYTTYVLCSARLVRRTEPLTSAAWVAIGASAGVCGWGIGRGDFGALPSDSYGPIAAMALATAAAFTLWFVVVGPLGSSRTAIIMMLEAPFGITLTALAFDDPLSIQILVGGALVLTGALLAAIETPIEAERLEAATSP
jgi:drug/metabolite transporter (DMT)-like permease